MLTLKESHICSKGVRNIHTYSIHCKHILCTGPLFCCTCTQIFKTRWSDSNSLTLQLQKKKASKTCCTRANILYFALFTNKFCYSYFPFHPTRDLIKPSPHHIFPCSQSKDKFFICLQRKTLHTPTTLSIT